MSAPQVAMSKPRWDGRRILFEIEHGGSAAACCISAAAVQELFGHRSFKPADLLRHFEARRGRIAQIAAEKLRSRPDSAGGLTQIWSSDIEDPPEAVPAA
jgi:hypothetical protein